MLDVEIVTSGVQQLASLASNAQCKQRRLNRRFDSCDLSELSCEASKSSHGCPTWKHCGALPFLVMVAIATVPAICSATGSDDVEAGHGGRFMSIADHGISAHGRKLLNLNLCGSGSAPDFSCKNLLRNADKATCCSDILNIKKCVDVGRDLLNCGSCDTKCPVGKLCCSGVCTDVLTDPNNCLICGRKCSGGLPCELGMCGYGSPGIGK